MMPNDNKSYVPSSGIFSKQNVIDKGKDLYKAYVLKFFNAERLSNCEEYLQKFFCEPVAKLLQEVAPTLQEATDRADLLRLLRLYADYYSLDALWSHKQNNFISTSWEMLSLVQKCYLNYAKWAPEDQKWLCSLCENIGSNYYLTENLHTYCIQSHELLYGKRRIHYIRLKGEEKFCQSSACGICQESGLHWQVEESFLPPVTWSSFYRFAGKRDTLSEESCEVIVGDVSDAVLHDCETFEQVPHTAYRREYHMMKDYRKLISKLKKSKNKNAADGLKKQLEDLNRRLETLNAANILFSWEARSRRKNLEDEKFSLKAEMIISKYLMDMSNQEEGEKQKEIRDLKEKALNFDTKQAGFVQEQNAKGDFFNQEHEKIRKEFRDLNKKAESIL
ncbi:MAG: hypothetical protein IJ793_04050 [Opitutales bacterium]|nr:hypothetical protein [Opitutales bacterium]